MANPTVIPASRKAATAGEDASILQARVLVLLGEGHAVDRDDRHPEEEIDAYREKDKARRPWAYI